MFETLQSNHLSPPPRRSPLSVNLPSFHQRSFAYGLSDLDASEISETECLSVRPSVFFHTPSQLLVLAWKYLMFSSGASAIQTIPARCANASTRRKKAHLRFSALRSPESIFFPPKNKLFLRFFFTQATKLLLGTLGMTNTSLETRALSEKDLLCPTPDPLSLSMATAS